MKKKELILVTAYCPTKEKKEVLLNFLKSVQPFRNQYSILLASHSSLDPLFFDYFDYFYFDKNNIVLQDIEYRQNAWFLPFGDYVIWSSYAEFGNTLKAVTDMIVPSISIAKTLNYEIIHMFEYDSVIHGVTELEENSRLLETYDYILYGGGSSHKMAGPSAFKTDRVIDEWKSKKDEMYEELFFDVYPKIPENVIYELIEKQRSFLLKDPEVLKKNGIETAKVKGNSIDWNVPFYDPKDDILKFFSFNHSSSPFEIKIIANGRLIDLGVVKTNNWKIENISGFSNFNGSLLVFKNNVKILDLDFQDEDYRRRFVKYNYVNYGDPVIFKYLGRSI